MHHQLDPEDYALTAAETAAFRKWTRERRKIFKEKPARRTPKPLPQGIAIDRTAHAVSYAACVGLAAEVLAAPSLTDAAYRVLPRLRRELASNGRYASQRTRWGRASERLKALAEQASS